MSICYIYFSASAFAVSSSPFSCPFLDIYVCTAFDNICRFHHHLHPIDTEYYVPHGPLSVVRIRKIIIFFFSFDSFRGRRSWSCWDTNFMFLMMPQCFYVNNLADFGKLMHNIRHHLTVFTSSTEQVNGVIYTKTTFNFSSMFHANNLYGDDILNLHSFQTQVN